MKKKKNVNPLDLDKETISKLDAKQLDALAGGKNDPDEEDEATCFIASNFTRTAIVKEKGCCGTTSSPEQEML